MSAQTNVNSAEQSAAKDKAAEEKREQLPTLAALEEDDEFEEFDTQDWEDTETDIAFLTSNQTNTGGQAANGQVADDSLWEENWDDDDIEDDFSKLLRAELEKSANGTPTTGTTS